MTVVKKWFLVIAVIISIAGMAFLAGCEGTKSDPSSSNVSVGDEAQETVAKSNVKGETFDSEKFSILVPDGWTKINSSVSVAFYTGNNMLEISITGNNVTEAGARQLLTDRAKQKGGTTPEEITMFGVKFFKTHYIESGLDMTVYSGARNGEMVQIAMVEIKDHPKHEEIIAMLESIKLK